jgi:integrase/recombinase XerD
MKKRVITLKSKPYKTLLATYRQHIRILGYSENGQEVKYANVLEFLTWLEAEKHYELTAIQPSHIKAYHQYLRFRPSKKQSGILQESTIQHHLHNVRTFFAWLQESGELLTNPMSTLKFHRPKSSSKIERTVLTIAQVQQLYRVCENLQERVILSLAYGCGLRAMELSSVNLDDIHLRDSILIVPQGKGNKRRVVPMSERVQQDIQNYIDNERDLYIKDEAELALLLNIKGKRLRHYTARKFLQHMVERTGEEAIISKNIALHNLRHSIATHLLEQGVSLEQVRNFLGHSHLETTEVYTRVNQEQLKALLS